MNVQNIVNQALALQKAGRLEEAKNLFLKILKAKPKDLFSLYGLGVIESQSGDLPAALSYFDKVVKSNARYAPGWYRRGVVLQELKRYDEALQSYNEALKLEPSDHGSLYCRGVSKVLRGDFTDALQDFDRLLKVQPRYAPGWHNRGYVLMQLNRYEEALASFDQAIGIDPKDVGSLVNRGTVLQALKRHGEAVENYDRLLELDPRHQKALCNKGIILTEMNRLDEGVEAFRELIEINPSYDFAWGLLYFAQLYICDWSNLERYRSQISAGIAEGRRVCKSLALLSISDDSLEHLRCARIFTKHWAPTRVPAWTGGCYRHDKIRIAYISPDFREHPVGHLTAGIFENHDRSRFETIAVVLNKDDGSNLYRRISSSFDRFITADRMSPQEAAELLRSLEVDVAVDLAGHTANSGFEIFTYRAAPIQVNYLGYPSTVGSDCIDYIIADHCVIPEENQPFFSEKVVYLPHTYLPTDAGLAVADRTPSREECGLPEKGFVFCSFNHSYKINPTIFQVWMQILKEVPDSVLWLMRLNDSAEANLRKEAALAGVAPQRLIFASRVPRVEDHLARYRVADLFLDTSPYNAHTTASDALFVGLPVLTLLGKAFPGRVAGSLLSAIGVTETITQSVEEYLRVAVELARDENRLGELRERLARNRKTHPLFNTAQFCRDLESAYLQMWERHQRGEQPESFSITGPSHLIEPRREAAPEAAAPKSSAPIVVKPTRTVSGDEVAACTKKAVVVIPVYKATLDPQEEFNVDYSLEKIPDRPVFFLAPEGLDQAYYRKRYPQVPFRTFEDRFFASIVGYNHLLLDSAFYHSFREYDYLLICQPDALILQDQLDYWMESGYDYIGAPWPAGVEVNLSLGEFEIGSGLNLKAYVGNGGFSLRSIPAHLRVLEEFPQIRDYWIRGGSSEDLFFAFAAMISQEFRVPNQMVAARFALEVEASKYFSMNQERVPMGCHAWQQRDPGFWEKIIAKG